MRIFYVHWHEEEALLKAAPLKEAGYDVQIHFSQQQHAKFGEQLPDVFVFSLERLPSHSKAIAEWVWEAKKRQHIPIIFEGGKEEKVEAFREKFPKAVFTDTKGLLRALKNCSTKAE